MIHVAVVGRITNPTSKIFSSGGDNGGWTSYMGSDQDEVVKRAINHAEQNNSKRPMHLMEVFVGELTLAAQTPVKFELIPLKHSPLKAPKIQEEEEDD